MGASITLAGESLIAQKQGNGQILDVTQIIFGYIPGLDTTLPVDRTAGFPVADDVVHTMSITRKGYLSPNQVVYSALMGSDIGDFDFNWMGLSTAEGTLLIAAYVPTQQKRREIPPLQTGNNLTRNIVLEYDGAQGLTGITVPASTWQFDFSTEFAAIRQDIAAIKVALANPTSAVSLDGPVLVYPNSANVYKITDYNRFSVFTATTSVGTVTIAADTLTLNIPTGAATGVVTLEVVRDGVKAPFKVALGASAIGTPSITSPANLAVGVALATTLTTSAFVAYPANADTHKDTDWRIKNAAGEVVWQSLANSANKTSITLPANALQPGVQYFPEARHNGAALGSSQYSPVTKFTTSAVSITTPTILSPINGATGIEETPTFTLSAFATVPAASDTHKSTSWRLRNAAGDVIWSSLNDTVNLLKLKLPAGLLVVAKNHTIEFQFNGVTLPSTPWQSSGFVTKAAFTFDKYLTLTGNTAGSKLLVYGQDIDTLKKIDNAVAQPTNAPQDIAYRPGGDHLAVGFGGAPYLQVYKVDGNNLVALPLPSTLPTVVRFLAYSDDGKWLAVFDAGTSKCYMYKVVGDTYTNVPFSAASNGNVPFSYCMCFVGSNQIFFGTETSPGARVYSLSNDEWFYSSAPASLPSSVAAIRRISIAAPYAIVGATEAGSGNPYYNQAYRTDLAVNWTPITIPSSGQDVVSCAISDDAKYAAFLGSGAPYLSFFKRNGDTWSRLADPEGSVASTMLAWSKDGIYLYAISNAAPFITVFKRSEDTLVKLANPSVLPPSTPYSIAVNPPARGA